MSTAKITLLGFYNHYTATGRDLFEKLIVPDGITKNTLVDTILMNGGEYESIYGDPDFIHDAVGVWSMKWYHTMERWARAINTDYEPLYNYDRTEMETRTPNLTHTRTADLTDQRTADLTNERTADLTTERTDDLTHERTANLLETNAGTITEETKRSAFDSSNYEPLEKKITTPENTLATTGTDTMTDTGTDTTTETGNEQRALRAYGNIGVTTSQQMLEDEIRISAWSLYDSIARLFLSEFVIPIMI